MLILKDAALAFGQAPVIFPAKSGDYQRRDMRIERAKRSRKIHAAALDCRYPYRRG